MADQENGYSNDNQVDYNQQAGVPEPAAPVTPAAPATPAPTTPAASYGSGASNPTSPLNTTAGYDVPGTVPTQDVYASASPTSSMPEAYQAPQPTQPYVNQHPAQAPVPPVVPPQPVPTPQQPAAGPYQNAVHLQPTVEPAYQPGAVLTQLTGGMKFAWLCIGALMGIPGMILAWLVNVDRHPQVKKDAIVWSVVGFAVNFVFAIIMTMVFTGIMAAAISSGGAYSSGISGGYYF